MAAIKPTGIHLRRLKEQAKSSFSYKLGVEAKKRIDDKTNKETDPIRGFIRQLKDSRDHFKIVKKKKGSEDVLSSAKQDVNYQKGYLKNKLINNYLDVLEETIIKDKGLKDSKIPEVDILRKTIWNYFTRYVYGNPKKLEKYNNFVIKEITKIKEREKIMPALERINAVLQFELNKEQKKYLLEHANNIRKQNKELKKKI